IFSMFYLRDITPLVPLLLSPYFDSISGVWESDLLCLIEMGVLPQRIEPVELLFHRSYSSESQFHYKNYHFHPPLQGRSPPISINK
ncbi:hypothetical protein ACJX0J_013758, partial [Zea mays]